jgi:NAD-dependent dihydropyrimidine dehydrogenase PreA subunit
MAQKNVFILPNVATPSSPVIFNPEICKGCNRCIEVCQIDVYMPNPEKGKPPIILHPEECWYCGVCIEDCPYPGAIKSNWPLQQRVHWKRKVTGERFRL